MNIKSMLLAVTAAITVFAAPLGANEASGPYQVIEETANAVAEALGGRREELEKNPAELYRVIDELLMPRFDKRYAGRLVLGKHWRRTNPEQRERFIEAFYNFLLRNYAKGVLQFDQDKIKLLPEREPLAPDENRAVVRTEMRLDDGNMVPVNYSLRLSKDGWRVYDVRIEGISYVQNYRNQFNAEIGAKGVDAVIKRLEAEAEQLQGGAAS